MQQTILAVVFLATGLLSAGLSVPLIRGRVPRNHLYGFRTPKTLSSDATWYPANRYSGRQLFGAGVATALGSLALLLVSGFLSTDAVALAGLALTLGPLGVAVFRSYRYLRSL
jgi:uncharacterized membrane protein